MINDNFVKQNLGSNAKFGSCSPSNLLMKIWHFLKCLEYYSWCEKQEITAFSDSVEFYLLCFHDSSSRHVLLSALLFRSLSNYTRLKYLLNNYLSRKYHWDIEIGLNLLHQNTRKWQFNSNLVESDHFKLFLTPPPGKI